jgi:hypothetical protein
MRVDKSGPASAAPHRRAAWTRPLAIVVGVLLVLAVAWHLTAISAYAASAENGPVGTRLADARLARTLEPWDERFQWRVVALEGLQLIDTYQLDRGYFLLLRYSTVVRGDPVFRQIYQQAVNDRYFFDWGTAHLAHGFDPNAPRPVTKGAAATTGTAPAKAASQK